MARQQFRLILRDLHKLGLDGFGDASVERASQLAQQRAIGRVLHQGVLEQIGRMRRRALPNSNRGDETVERRSQLRLRLARRRCQQSMREFAPDRRPICATSLAGRAGRAAPSARRAGSRDGKRGDGTAAAVRRAWLSPSASSNRLGHLLNEQRNAVGTLDNVLPDVRRKKLVAGDAVDHGVDFALRQPIEGERGHLRPSDPGRFELRSETSRSAARGGSRSGPPSVRTLPGWWGRSNARPRRSSAPDFGASALPNEKRAPQSSQPALRRVRSSADSAVIRKRKHLGEQRASSIDVVVGAKTASSLSSFARGASSCVSRLRAQSGR